MADFGISTVRSTITRQLTVVGTPVYMAPEVLNNEKYSEKADIYSFGMVLWEIFTGNRPYEDEQYRSLNHFQLVQCILNNERPSLDGIESTISQIICECWNINPVIRPSMNEIVVRLKRLKLNRNKSGVESELSADDSLLLDFENSNSSSKNLSKISEDDPFIN